MDNIDVLVCTLSNYFWEYGTWAEEQDCWQAVTNGLRAAPEGIESFHKWADQIRDNNPPAINWGKYYQDDKEQQ